MRRGNRRKNTVRSEGLPGASLSGRISWRFVRRAAYHDGKYQDQANNCGKDRDN
jgi:hypothetical protein